MKNKLLIVYLVFLHLLVIVILVESDFLGRVGGRLGLEGASEEWTSAYQDMVTYQARMDGNIPDDSILFLGDSLVQSLAVTAISEKAVNLGIGNDTSLGVLQRLATLPSIRRARMVVIAVGANDVPRRGNAEIVSNMAKMVDCIPSNVGILFSAILPVDERIREFRGRNEKIGAVNRMIREMCSRHPRVHVLDISERVAESTGNLSPKYHVGDGIHLNTDGYAVWIKAIRDVIEKAEADRG